jgi:hypothetical protein
MKKHSLNKLKMLSLNLLLNTSFNDSMASMNHASVNSDDLEMNIDFWQSDYKELSLNLDLEERRKFSDFLKHK